jgi:DNA-binding GntR family transcriptional regulator
MEEIYSAMFDKIISGEYPTGTHLKQEDIAKEFNISRTPVRIVLQQLDQDGLLQFTPNKGAKVLPFSADEIEEIYEIRKSLELLCMDVSTPVLSIQKLLELKKDVLENLQNDDVEVLADLDARLHSYIIESTKKKRLILMVNQLYRLLQRFRTLGYLESETRQQALNEHIEIIDALCVRDTVNAKAFMKKHIENSKIIALSQLFKSK